MELKLRCGASRDAGPILAALEAADVQLDSVLAEQSWPEWLELQAAGALDFHRLDRAVKTMCGALCPDEATVPIRIVREADTFDLLYFIPCDDWEKSAAALEVDIRRYADPEDSFRSWFRGEWMGQRDEDALTVEELSSEPLLPARILAYLDPPVFRDWRPIFSFIERHATCDQLAGAMANAKTPTQKWKLAYAFHRGRRSCLSAIPMLIAWLRDEDRKVREEAAYSLGSLILAIRHPGSRVRWAQQAGAALLEYVSGNSNDNLYFARESLGATGYEPARPYLEELALTGIGDRKESAERGLFNLEKAVAKRSGGQP